MATSLVSTGVTFPDSTTQTTAYLGGAGKAANTQTFTSSGTWTKPSGYGANSRVLIQCWGGGGSGGTFSGGFKGGGGGGGYNFRWVALSAMGSTETATIGAGGTVTGGIGNVGGNTSLGSLVVAYGGGGGGAGSSSTTGGGGGGQLSVGVTAGGTGGGFPGRPIFGGWPTNSSTNLPANTGYTQLNANTATQGGSGGLAGSGYSAFTVTGGDALMHGGGGGGSLGNCIGTYVSPGGNSVWGGGGGGAGGSGINRAGGTSTYAGAGGAGVTTGSGTAGTAPSGGGGAGTTGGAGAAGQIIVTVFDGA